MMVKENKEFNHNLIIVGIVGVVAIIGILITLSTGTYTGKVSGMQTEQIAMFDLYQNCKDMYGYESGCASDLEYMGQIKDWCSCRVYDRIFEIEPTADTEIYKAEVQATVMKDECSERPTCNQGVFGGEITGKVAGIEYRKIRNVKDFASCLNKFGNVKNFDAYTQDAYKADYSEVPAELVSWCGCRFSDVIPNFHEGDARLIVRDVENFYGEVVNSPLKEECGPNPITGE